MNDMKEANNCPCKKTKCPRYGNCEACKRYHYGKQELPKCER